MIGYGLLCLIPGKFRDTSSSRGAKLIMANAMRTVMSASQAFASTPLSFADPILVGAMAA